MAAEYVMLLYCSMNTGINFDDSHQIGYPIKECPSMISISSIVNIKYQQMIDRFYGNNIAI